MIQVRAECTCRVFHHFAPPEFCTVWVDGEEVEAGGKGGDNTYVLDPKTEV